MNEEFYHAICCTGRNSVWQENQREERGKLLIQSRLLTLIGSVANRELKSLEAFLN